MPGFLDLFRAPVPPVPAPPPAQDVFTDRLPAALAGTEFVATFTAAWQPLRPSDRAAATLRWCLLDAARRIAANRKVTERTMLEAELNTRMPQVDLTASHLRLLSCTISLKVDSEAEQDTKMVDKLSRELRLQRMRHQLEQEQMTYLRERVLTDPTTARCYWLAHHPGTLEPLLDDTFERVATKLTGGTDQQGSVIAETVHDFVGGLSPEERRYLLDRLGDVFVSFDRGDLAGRVLDA
ncbi:MULTISPECIES: hypothetical protein [unclassified Solwaraspora]|uniref:hypothetical protein n=1 Tax=unclassified Solwaraspora TaxID=2627926 RepID=UPI00259B1406|nr:hypothetical protein [Solwaraspora sp. WMMA2056]WJK42703.1 hypothetical protein O7608_10160 [Solwaraspora sp. WMMA2056]